MTRKKKPATSLVRSSAAEYLTFVAASGTGGVEAVYADENVWLSQKMMAQLYDVEVTTINYHLKKVFEDSELEENAVIRNLLITAADGKTYDTKHYNLSAIIAVGYKVNSEPAVQFRKWATRVVEEFTIKGFAMDDERLKRGGSVLSDRYFGEQLQRVREIRLSGRRFYQKITDIYATSVDYDVTAQATKRFFATVQNKLHWAIHGQTAAEVVVAATDREVLQDAGKVTAEIAKAHAERVREVPDRAGPPLRERLRSRRGRHEAPWGGCDRETPRRATGKKG
jgi:hypothetical protein